MRKTQKMAFSGVIVGLSILVMLITAIIPFADYSSPTLAGALLIMIVIEINRRTAVIAYTAVGILALIMVPSKEVAILYIAFLGYYPILKSVIERVKLRSVEYFLKLLLFNIAIITAYFIIVNVAGLKEVIDDLPLGSSKALLLAAGNVAFILYDYVLTQAVAIYLQKRRIKH